MGARYKILWKSRFRKQQGNLGSALLLAIALHAIGFAGLSIRTAPPRIEDALLPQIKSNSLTIHLTAKDPVSINTANHDAGEIPASDTLAAPTIRASVPPKQQADAHAQRSDSRSPNMEARESQTAISKPYPVSSTAARLITTSENSAKRVPPLHTGAETPLRGPSQVAPDAGPMKYQEHTENATILARPQTESATHMPAPESFEVQLGQCNIPQPPYPPKALRLGKNGKVGLLLTVNEAGRPVLVSVLSTSRNDDLDRAAVDAAYQGTCEPYLENGHPRPVRLAQTISFSLQN